jgi:hypothetical protein
MKRYKPLFESSQRFCAIYKAQNNKWYLALADEEYGTSEDATTYGPFSSKEQAHRYLLRNFSNPGGIIEDGSGEHSVPPSVVKP